MRVCIHIYVYTRTYKGLCCIKIFHNRLYIIHIYVKVMQMKQKDSCKYRPGHVLSQASESK